MSTAEHLRSWAAFLAVLFVNAWIFHFNEASLVAAACAIYVNGIMTLARGWADRW